MRRAVTVKVKPLRTLLWIGAAVAAYYGNGWLVLALAGLATVEVSVR